MIYTTLEHLPRHLGMDGNLDRAIAFLTGCDLAALPNGRSEIAGEEVFVNVFEYDTVSEEEGQWEAHIRYADIHVDIAGTERIGVSHLSALRETVRREEEDFVGCEGPVTVWAPLRPGAALVVFPEDAHMVKVQNSGPSHVRKAVVKVRMGET